MSLSGSFHQGLHIETARRDGTVAIVLHGELDLSNATALDAELRRAETTDATAIEVDLRHLRFLDPTGVAVFLRARFRDGVDGRRLRLLPGSAQVQRTFRLCGTESVLFGMPMSHADADGDGVA